MEHRCGSRKEIELSVLLYRQGLPVHSACTRDLGQGGVFVQTRNYPWRKHEILDVELVNEEDASSVRLPAVVVHHREEGAGLMFDLVSAEQSEIIRGWLSQERSPAELVEQIEREVA